MKLAEGRIKRSKRRIKGPEILALNPEELLRQIRPGKVFCPVAPKVREAVPHDLTDNRESISWCDLTGIDVGEIERQSFLGILAVGQLAESCVLNVVRETVLAGLPDLRRSLNPM